MGNEMQVAGCCTSGTRDHTQRGQAIVLLCELWNVQLDHLAVSKYDFSLIKCGQTCSSASIFSDMLAGCNMFVSYFSKLANSGRSSRLYKRCLAGRCGRRTSPKKIIVNCAAPIGRVEVFTDSFPWRTGRGHVRGLAWKSLKSYPITAPRTFTLKRFC